MKNVKSFAAGLIVIIIAAGLIFGLRTMKPKTKKGRPQRPVPIVEAVIVSPSREAISIEATGTVIPARQLAVNTEVEGKIVAMNSELVPGGLIAKGAVIARIDPADYEYRVSELRAALVEAESRFDIERGKQAVALKEWTIFEKEGELDSADKGLAIREPQLKSAEAQLEASRSRLDSALLALEKTKLMSPFNAIVIEEAAEVGQFFGRQGKIATLVGTDSFWVQVSVPQKYLSRIRLPKGNKKGSSVKITLESLDEKGIVRQGSVLKILGDLDTRGRMARLLVAIDDPLNLAAEKDGGALLLGTYVRLEIEAGSAENVYRIPRENVVDGKDVLILKADNTLDVRPVDIRWRTKDDFLVAVRIAEGERLIISRLQNALPGMTLRASGDRPAGKKVQEGKIPPLR